MTAIESVTLEVADPTAAERFYTAPPSGWRHGAPAGRGGADDRLPRVHAVAHGVPAGHRRQPVDAALDAGATR